MLHIICRSSIDCVCVATRKELFTTFGLFCNPKSLLLCFTVFTYLYYIIGREISHLTLWHQSIILNLSSYNSAVFHKFYP